MARTRVTLKPAPRRPELDKLLSAARRGADEFAGASDATLRKRLEHLIMQRVPVDGAWFARMESLIAELKRRKANQK